MTQIRQNLKLNKKLNLKIAIQHKNQLNKKLMMIQQTKKKKQNKFKILNHKPMLKTWIQMLCLIYPYGV